MSEKNLDPNEESTMETYAEGLKIWKDNQGKLHRLKDHAVEYPDGSKAWYVHGENHKVDGPAIEASDGQKLWYVHNELIVTLKPKNK